MKPIALKSCLLAAVFSATAYADNVVVTESLSDKVKCVNKVCYVVTEGKFNVSAKISADSFAQHDIYLDEIYADTPLEIKVGNFQFASTLADADVSKFTNRGVTAKWFQTYDECRNESCDKIKTVKYEQVGVNGGLNGIALKISGKSKAGGDDEYGRGVFADSCKEAGDGAELSGTATLTVDGIPLSGGLTINCKVKTKTVTKYGESFDLVSATVRAGLSDM
ncbi:hypothetical protein [Methylomicrobium lacus]|uniref:hypothetical protein n=1 Tax=Methylomicrobium lacus TaxID=136992 RepID=UPI0035A81F1A